MPLVWVALGLGGLWVIGRLQRNSPAHPANAFAALGSSLTATPPAAVQVSDQTSQNAGPLVTGEGGFGEDTEGGDMIAGAPESLYASVGTVAPEIPDLPAGLRGCPSCPKSGAMPVATIAQPVSSLRRPAPVRIGGRIPPRVTVGRPRVPGRSFVTARRFEQL